MHPRKRASRVRWLVAAGLLGAVWALQPAAAGEGPAERQRRAQKPYTVPELVKAVSPAVVFVGNIDREGRLTGFGSGFVVFSSGLVVTNFHVIEGAAALQVKMKDGEIYDRVEILDYDRRRDLAVLKIRPFKTLPTVTLGESSMVEVGEEVVAIGNPQGLEHTVSAGMVSAFRQAEGFRLIQMSVPISPGSSGGPLFDLRGRVVGITSAGVVAEGAQNLNFAIPAEYVWPLVTSKATPMSVAEFMEKVGASPASARASSGGSGSGRVRAAWAVAHDHEGSAFKDFCVGRLYLSDGAVGFTTDSGRHAWEAPLSAIKEVAKNALDRSEYGAFHIRLITNTNYNFVAIDDQLRFQSPEPILLAIVTALQRIK